MATLEAEVVRAEDVGRKDLAGLYLLRVTKVDGVGLSPGQVFKFATVAGVPSLPMDVFELHKQRTGKNVDELAEEDVRRAEKEFVGKKLTCLASEVVDPPVPNGPGKGGGASESTLLIRRLLDNKQERQQAVP